MSIQTVSLSQLVPSKANPRKSIRDVEGLAASIKTDGLLQNLVVQPLESEGKRKNKHYAIISGERRYRALQLLEERGELPDDFSVPVEIREQISTDEALRIATVENLQRADLTPLEQTAALTKLVHKGAKLDDVAAQTGLSAATIKRRLALNGLCKEAKAALRKGEITLAQAESLTLGSDEGQRSVLDEIVRGYSEFTADGIKSIFLDERPNVAMAIFPPEKYTGTITTDLFAVDETSYFDDAEQFFKLQRAAAQLLADDYRKSAAWVEVTESRSIPSWQYREAKKKEPWGVIVNLSPSGKVTVESKLVKREIDQQTAADTAENPIAPRKAATYSASLCRLITHHKSVAVQEVLLANPRKAKEVAAVHAVMYLKPHECIRGFAKETDTPHSYQVIEAQARINAVRLGIEIEEDGAVWDEFPAYSLNDCELYEAIKRLSDHELDELHTLLAVLSFGQMFCDRLDTGDTLFNRVAQDLAIDMRNHWRPDRAFFERRNRSQLVAIAKECGYADGRSSISGYKKSELVSGLIMHFADSFAAADPAEAHVKAKNWLPGVMQFPAIDPDAALATEEAADEPIEEDES